MALAISVGFVLLFFVIALGSRFLVDGALISALPRIIEWMLVAGVVGSIYGIYGVVVLDLPLAQGVALGANSFGGLIRVSHDPCHWLSGARTQDGLAACDDSDLSGCAC